MKMPSAIRRWRDRTRIRTQLSLIVSASAILLVALLILYSYLSQRQANQRHEATSLQRVLALESAQIEAYVDELAAFSLQLRNDSAFMSLLTQSEGIGYADQQTLENAFRAQFYSRDDLAWMELYLIRPRLLLRLDTPRRKLTSQDYADPRELEDSSAFLSGPGYLSVQSDADGFLRVTRTIIDSPRTTPLAVVRFLVDPSLPGRLTRSHRQNDESLYLFDADGTPLAEDEYAAEVLEALHDGRTLIAPQGHKMLLVACESGPSGISAAVIKPLSAIHAALDRTLGILTGIGLAALAAISLILLGSIHALLRPLETLAQQMQRVGRGEFRERAALTGSSEMIGLSDDVNRMIENISELIDRTYIASLNERTAQLAALEAQTNPHFLFNTLQAIATEAILADDRKVYRMITTLASLLRYSIKGGNLVDLKTELEYVEKYLTLQVSRFGERLQYRIDADEALLERSVPKLGLLALAENSIVHGMQGDVEAIHLVLSCRLREGQADIRVTDDGAGIPPQRLDQLRAAMADETVVVMQNIGLGNLASRLRLLYNGSAKLMIDSTAGPPRQTTVRIQIPLEVMTDVHGPDH